MKKILFILCLITVFPLISEAQVQEYGRFMPGIKLGAVVTGATGTHYSGFPKTHEASGIIAFYGDYRFDDMWAIAPEAGFTVIKDAYGTRNYYNTGTRPKLYIASLVKFYIPKAKGFHVTLGPELGITARKLSYGRMYFPTSPFPPGEEPPGWPYEPSPSHELKYNPLTFAINSGIGYRFKKGVAFNAEYSAGLTRIIHKNEGTDYNTVKDGMFRFTIAIDLYRRNK
ncbi:MAG: hypothetical protein K2L01_06820 [Rikenellaceae bacterium]|nr:hypothetical protein [Rikenellaceae bacterium]